MQQQQALLVITAVLLAAIPMAAAREGEDLEEDKAWEEMEGG